VPKTEETEPFSMDGLISTMHNLAKNAHAAFPFTIYYRLKQSEMRGESDRSSSRWEFFLETILQAGFAIVGTWPIRTESAPRTVALGSNALTCSIVLVCRQRSTNTTTISRSEFVEKLNATLPEALLDIMRGGVDSSTASVDLSLAIIGPGMAIFSQYAAVLETDGTPMSVHTALQLINRFRTESDFDNETQFCMSWFDQMGWTIGKFDQANALACTKGASIEALQNSGVVDSDKEKLRLCKWTEMSINGISENDKCTSIWRDLHQLIRCLNQDGETSTGKLLTRMSDSANIIRALAYRLYALCKRKGWGRTHASIAN
jgi:putative DNA methylase